MRRSLRRQTPLVAIVAATLLSGFATPVLAAPHERHLCPAEARGSVTHDGGAEWVATSQSSRALDARIAPIGGVVALVCVYQMFGSEYWIYKRPSPEYTTCRPEPYGDRRGFYCSPT